MTKLRNNHEVKSSYIQCENWKKLKDHKDENLIPLVHFFDEFQCTEPTKSHGGEQKFGATYTSLPCLPPHLANKASNIFLSSVFNSRYLSSCELNMIFNADIQELNYLYETGLKIRLDSGEVTLRFATILYVGDNLGLNCTCGFSGSFISAYYGRLCRASKEKCQYLTKELKTLVRNVSNYQKDLRHGSHGVISECIFNSLKTLHIAVNQSLDLMHDLFEGVAKDVVEKCLTTLVCVDQRINLETINHRIDTFPYSDFEKNNKPRPLTMETTSASDEQMTGLAKKKSASNQQPKWLVL